MSLQTAAGSGLFTPEQVFDGEKLLTNKTVIIKNGIVEEVVDSMPDASPLRGTISPGFFDLQVNGGGGVMFNANPTAGGIKSIVNAHRRRGTTTLLPTVITDTADILDAACNTLIECKNISGVAGIHIEGPHISVEKAGVHNKRDIRPLDELTLALLRNLRDNEVSVLITVAPEAVKTGQIAQMVEMGVVVSLGHSNASAIETKRCVEEGAALFTHLYNAMSPMHSREPGMVGAAINSQAFCSIICDGKHVTSDMIALAIRARPIPNRMIIVSDAMPTIGGGTRYQLYEEQIELQQGTLVDRNGALAGAHITMGESIDFLMSQVGLNLEMALQMAITHPATVMRQPQLCNLIGCPAQQCIAFQPGHASRATTLDSALPGSR